MALKMHTKVITVPAEPVAVIEPQKVFVELPDQTVVETLTAEYIDLYRKYDYFEVKALLKRMDEIKKQLQAVANETVDDLTPAVFTSPEGDVEFSPRGKSVEVPDPLGLIYQLLEKFGPEVTASVITIAITPLRKVLSEYELKPHLQEKLGSRTLRAVRPLHG